MFKKNKEFILYGLLCILMTFIVLSFSIIISIVVYDSFYNKNEVTYDLVKSDNNMISLNSLNLDQDNYDWGVYDPRKLVTTPSSFKIVTYNSVGYYSNEYSFPKLNTSFKVVGDEAHYGIKSNKNFRALEFDKAGMYKGNFGNNIYLNPYIYDSGNDFTKNYDFYRYNVGTNPYIEYSINLFLSVSPKDFKINDSIFTNVTSISFVYKVTHNTINNTYLYQTFLKGNNFELTYDTPNELFVIYINNFDTNYNDGYNDGKADGLIEGYENGKADGLIEGYNEGYNEGYSEGEYNGYLEGYEKGKADAAGLDYNNGYDDGYNLAKDVFYNNGYIDGKKVGFENGYNDGYNKGIVDNPNNNFGTMIASVLVGVGTVLSIQLLPGISIGAIIAVPIVFGVIAFVLGRKKE